jgi:hypothetical protein
MALGLAGHDSGWLQHLALMQQGAVSGAPLKPGGLLAAGTAAWKTFSSNRTLVWRASERRWAAAPEPRCSGACSASINLQHLLLRLRQFPYSPQPPAY